MSSSATGHARGVESHVATIGDLSTYYLDAPGGPPTLVLLHGLSANASVFHGLLAAGLSSACRVIAPDLRGRARSGKPAQGYTMADHARDVIGLMDKLGLDRVVLGGHSFGGYLSIYIAVHYPERVEKLIVIDSAVNSTPQTVEMLKPSLARLERIAPSTNVYLETIRTAPYMNGVWDEAAMEYFRAEIRENPDGTAQSATSLAAIVQAIEGVTAEPWLHWIQQVPHPTLLLNAIDPFGPGNPALMSEVDARATAKAFRDARYAIVPGNHITMMFTPGAMAIRTEIEQFISSENGNGGARQVT